MLKLAGCVMVVAATTLFGVRKASDIRESYIQLQYVQRLVYLIQSEIRYARSYLGEIFQHVGAGSKEPYKSWLTALSARMEETREESFAVMWENSIEEYLDKLPLPENEMHRLKALGGQLGNMDLAMQIKTLDLYQEQLAQSMEELREGMKTKIKLWHCLGVMSGMLIAVLLL